MKTQSAHKKRKMSSSYAASNSKTRVVVPKKVRPGPLTAQSVFLRPVKVDAEGSAW